MNYTPKKITAAIYLLKADIGQTGCVKFYDTTDDPSSEGTWVATARAVDAGADPSAMGGECWLFSCSWTVAECEEKTYRWIVYDAYGNEGTSDTFQETVCLTPATPTLSNASVDSGTLTFDIG